jgi:hypothetical protein
MLDGPLVKILRKCSFVFCFHGGPRMEGKTKEEGKSGTKKNVSESCLLRYDTLFSDISEEPNACIIELTAEIA